MKTIKAIVFGVGAMGRLAAKMMTEKGVEIVGAIDTRSNIGKDLGEVADLPQRLGVIISDDISGVLNIKADIAVICARSYLDEMHPYFKQCIEKKLNIVTLAEEAFYPWRLFPEKTTELDRLAKENGVTLTSGGIQDIFWLNLLTALSGSSHQIDLVTGQAVSNVDLYGPAAIEAIGVGQTEAQFKERIANDKLDYSWFGITLESIIAGLDMTLKIRKEWVEPVVAEEDTASKGLYKTIPKGFVIGWNQVTEIVTEEGAKFRSEFISKICKEDEIENMGWVIKGVPDLYLIIPNVPGPYAICSALVNRIPDVINSEPGFVTLDKFPVSKYKVHPLGYYVK
jgi:4-hydroxy-tetrahydrodipicolinate reductase